MLNEATKIYLQSIGVGWEVIEDPGLFNDRYLVKFNSSLDCSSRFCTLADAEQYIRWFRGRPQLGYVKAPEPSLDDEPWEREYGHTLMSDELFFLNAPEPFLTEDRRRLDSFAHDGNKWYLSHLGVLSEPYDLDAKVIRLVSIHWPSNRPYQMFIPRANLATWVSSRVNGPQYKFLLAEDRRYVDVELFPHDLFFEKCLPFIATREVDVLHLANPGCKGFEELSILPNELQKTCADLRKDGFEILANVLTDPNMRAECEPGKPGWYQSLTKENQSLFAEKEEWVKLGDLSQEFWPDRPRPRSDTDIPF